MTIQIYPGSDGEFILYENDGETMENLRGETVQIRFTWKNKDRQLTVHPVEGAKNNFEQRQFQIKLVSGSFEKMVNYTGEELKIQTD